MGYEIYPQSVYSLGVDLGRMRNPTALALLEECTGERMGYDSVECKKVPERVLVLRDVRALELETPYVELPRLLERYRQALKPGMKVHVTVDATGVGAAVVELLQRADLGVELHPVVITGGEAVGRLKHATTVPRTALLENMRVRLERRDFRIPAGLPRLKELREELAGLGEDDGHPDDLAFALALALWQMKPGLAVGERGEILAGSPVADEWTKARMRGVVR